MMTIIDRLNRSINRVVMRLMGWDDSLTPEQEARIRKNIEETLARTPSSGGKLSDLAAQLEQKQAREQMKDVPVTVTPRGRSVYSISRTHERTKHQRNLRVPESK
jgi:hypothetical protein